MRHSRPAKHPAKNDVVLKIRLDARSSFLVECLAEDIANQAATSGSGRLCIREALDLLNLALSEALAVQ